MREEKYIVMSEAQWEQAKEGGFMPKGTSQLHNMTHAGVHANNDAAAYRKPVIVLKLVPVARHTAQVNLTVDAL